ncbi:ATP-dependent DNA ligase [Sesbania bispinosa]|nr:ATP-dependent DNA ligase [Sesbania bispinosa]
MTVDNTAGSGEAGDGFACCWGFRHSGAVTKVVSWLVQGGRGWVWLKGRCTVSFVILSSVAPTAAGMDEKWGEWLVCGSDASVWVRFEWVMV